MYGITKNSLFSGVIEKCVIVRFLIFLIFIHSLHGCRQLGQMVLFII